MKKGILIFTVICTMLIGTACTRSEEPLSTEKNTQESEKTDIKSLLETGSTKDIYKYIDENSYLETEDIKTLLGNTNSSDVIAIYYNFDFAFQYAMTSKGSVEEFFETVKSQEVEQLKNDPELAYGGIQITIITDDKCYNIGLSGDYLTYGGKFYSSENNSELIKLVMQIYLKDIKDNDQELYEKYLDDGTYDYYFD